MGDRSLKSSSGRPRRWNAENQKPGCLQPSQHFHLTSDCAGQISKTVDRPIAITSNSAPRDNRPIAPPPTVPFAILAIVENAPRAPFQLRSPGNLFQLSISVITP